MSAIILDFSRVPFVDISAARAVETIISDARDAKKTVYETGMTDSVRETLGNLNSIHGLPVDTSFEHRIDALRAAVNRILKQRGQT